MLVYLHCGIHYAASCMPQYYALCTARCLSLSQKKERSHWQGLRRTGRRRRARCRALTARSTIGICGSCALPSWSKLSYYYHKRTTACVFAWYVAVWHSISDSGRGSKNNKSNNSISNVSDSSDSSEDRSSSSGGGASITAVTALQ